MRFRNISLSKLIKERDSLGHPIRLLLRGEDSYRTICGGLVSIAIQIMTMILIYESLINIVFMDSPEIISFEKPMSVEDKKSLAPLHFNDYGYTIAMKIAVFNYETYEWSMGLPQKVGSFDTWVYHNEEWVQLELKHCSDILAKETIDASS